MILGCIRLTDIDNKNTTPLCCYLEIPWLKPPSLKFWFRVYPRTKVHKVCELREIVHLFSELCRSTLSSEYSQLLHCSEDTAVSGWCRSFCAQLYLEGLSFFFLLRFQAYFVIDVKDCWLVVCSSPLPGLLRLQHWVLVFSVPAGRSSAGNGLMECSVHFWTKVLRVLLVSHVYWGHRAWAFWLPAASDRARQQRKEKRDCIACRKRMETRDIDWTPVRFYLFSANTWILIFVNSSMLSLCKTTVQSSRVGWAE